MMMNAPHPSLEPPLLVKEEADQVLDLDGSQVLSCHRLRPGFLNDALKK